MKILEELPWYLLCLLIVGAIGSCTVREQYFAWQKDFQKLEAEKVKP